MKILVLGGTRFVGRRIIVECLARGDDVTLLSRGHSPSPFAGLVRHVLADRRAPTPDARTTLAAPWDAVIDTSGHDTDDLRPVVAALGPIGRYVFVSTCGVYRRIVGCTTLTERSPTIVADASHPAKASATRKLRCERLLRRRLDQRGVPLLIARLGLVIGRHDDSERLAYWLERALRAGSVLVPMDPDQPIQLIDVTDVARFLRRAIDQRLAGVVNLAGPRTTVQTLLDTILASGPADACWVGGDFALAYGLRPWTEVPLWLPTSSPERALMSVGSIRPETAGLACRPLPDTLADCLAWQRSRHGWSPRWLDPVRERRLLSQWRG